MLFSVSFCRVLTCLSLFGPSLVLGLPIRREHVNLQMNTTPSPVEKRAYGSICNIPLRSNHQKFVAFIELDAIIHVLLLHTRDGCGWEAKVDIRHIIIHWLFFHSDDFWRATLPGRISRLLLWICIIVLPRFPHRLACSWVENNVLLEQDRMTLIHSPEEVAHSKVLCRKDIYFGFL